ncbi:hypothetical protein Aduo_001088 [Ancylostoma duodenale]
MFCSDPVVEIYFRNAGKLVDQCQKCMLTSYHGRPWQRRFDSPSATFETHISTISAAISSSLSQQLSYSVVISSSPAREKTVSFKIFCKDVPRFSVTYKDKKDMFKDERTWKLLQNLYESFKKKVAELNLKNGTIYWIDDDSDLIETAEDLFAASKDEKL